MTTKAQLESALKKLDVKVNNAREIRINKDGELTMKLDGVKLSFDDSPIQLQLVFDKHETLVFLDEMMNKKKENVKN